MAFADLSESREIERIMTILPDGNVLNKWNECVDLMKFDQKLFQQQLVDYKQF